MDDLTQSRQTAKEESMMENDVAKVVVDCAFKVHTKLGPGLLESVYEALIKTGIKRVVNGL